MTSPHQTPLCGGKHIKTWLEHKYGTHAIRDIVNEITITQRQKQSLDYMRFKELSELVEATRIQAMVDLYRVKRWRRDGMKQNKNQKITTTPFNPLNDIVRIENQFMERKASQSWDIYRKVNHLFHKLYKKEMARCSEKGQEDQNNPTRR